MADKQEKTPRSRREFIIAILGWLVYSPFLLYAAGLILSRLLMYMFVIWCLFNPNCYEIQHSFCEAVEREDKAAVFKYAKAYEKREKKDVRRVTWDPSVAAFEYKLWYMLAYEFNEDYDKALACEAELSEKRKTSRSVYGSEEHYSTPYDRARLLYKKGLKKEAFIEYCSKQTIDDDYKARVNYWQPFSTLEEYDAFLKGFKRRQQSLITLQGQCKEEMWRVKFSCFAEYAEFLEFINTEYEKLGSPEEYAGAVEKYRLLALDQGWYCEPSELKPALHDGTGE